MKTSILTLLTVSYCSLMIHADVPRKQLKLIQVIFRHGHRMPTKVVKAHYPLNPYVNETWYPEGWSSLTNDGKRSAYELGQFLKQRYGQWLGDVYLKDNVVFRSSTTERAIMSTQLVAAGLFPPTQVQRWKSDLYWQPIPVIPEPFNDTYVFSFTRHMCPKYKAMRTELEKTNDALRNRAERLRNFFDFVSTNVGTRVGQRETSLIYHELYSQWFLNLELPEWTNGILLEGKLKEIAAFDYVIQSYNKTMIQLTGGIWIREWLRNVDGCLNTQNEVHKGFFYGGHEANVAAILTALGVFEPHVPFYSSAVIFELSRADAEFHVKVLYRNVGLLRELIIPGCGSPSCPLSTFRKLFDDIVVQDPIALCQHTES